MKLLIATGLVLTGMALNSIAGYVWQDRAAWGCAQVKEANGGDVVLVKIHENPTVWDTQFVNGVVRWECGDDHSPAY